MKNSAELFLTFFVLALMYSCFLVYTVLRLYQSRKFIREWKYARLIYSFQVVQLVLRSSSFWLVCVYGNTISSSEDLSFSILTMPDSLIIASFIVLFWIMITCTMYTRIESEFNEDERGKLQRAGKITLAVLVVWLTFELMLYGLLFLGVIPKDIIVLILSIWSLLTSGIVIAGVIIVQVKYSGLPFKTVQSGKYLKTVLFVTFVWTIARITHGVLYLIREDSFRSSKSSGIDEMFDSTETIILIIVDLLLTEVLCYYFILDYSFFRIFLSDVINDSHISAGFMTQGISMHEEFEAMSDFHEISMESREILSQQKGKLGILSIADTDKSKVVIRTISLQRVNKYVLENLQVDIEEINKLQIHHLVSILNCNIQKTEVDLFMPYFDLGSLYFLIHVTKYRFSTIKKLEIAQKIAKIFSRIHAAKRSHGHLTSHNILMGKGYEPYVSDLGLEHLKKFCGLVIGYTNKSAWSSPELLKDPSLVVTKSNPADDIYSFGILLWELIFNQEPFPGYSLARLKELVVEQGYRPAIEGCEVSGISELLKTCWNKDPANRPDFEFIERQLSVILNTLDII